MTAYYNEIDPYAADWMRNLIAEGHIARGIVDERSVEDVHPRDLDGFTQCHFFAGVGVWSYALRLAGWPDDRPVWTGSCPCQPFSAAGQGAGFADERHLWPAWHHLICERSPAEIIGEQVASKDADPWVDLVQDDLEALGYAFGAIPFPSAGVGAPHIRDRLYWVANADRQRFGGQHSRVRRSAAPGRIEAGDTEAPRRGAALPMAQPAGARPQGGTVAGQRADAQREAAERGSAAGSLADASGARVRGAERRPDAGAQGRAEGLGQERQRLRPDAGHAGDGPTRGFWADAEWIACRDGKLRPVEPGTFPLAHGAPARVGRLRAYGNAINAEAAAAWIRCYLKA